MRLVFIDMHCINFLTNTYSQIKDGMKVKTYKHKFLIDYAINNQIHLANFISFNVSTNRSFRLKVLKLIFKNKLVNLFNNYISGIYYKEAKFVLDNSYGIKNGIEIITSHSDIKENDIIIGYLFDRNQLDVIKKIKNGHKVLMGNHFIAINQPYDLKENKIDAFVNEIDLSDNSFANKYLNSNGVKNIVCPYVYADRFKNLQLKRKNKAMAIGTLSTCKGNSGYNLYRKEYGTEWIQLMRKEIYDHEHDYPQYIDSYISYIFEDKKVIEKSDSIFVKIYKKIYNRQLGWTQSKYTSFDMVEKFNEYMMFVCPEEQVGMPGIGFVEGMACGTAYVGLDTSYYRKLGLVPGKHYIVYDGSLDNLIKVISFYQEHPDEVREIAKNGMDFVRQNFNSEVVAKKFFNELDLLLQDIR